MTDAIDVRALHKRYGRRTALHALDLQVRPGSVFGLIGPNGAGKTTTLRTLLDVIRPSSGTVRVLGEDPRRGGPDLRRRIGYVPGELHLEGRASGHRLLSFYAEVSGMTGSKDAVLRTARELGDRLGVDLDRPVRTLSKGNKQKVGLIQAFMHRPELLILDEPTSGLDPLVQREFLAMVREVREAGQTVLLSSHVLSEIQQAADEVAVLAAGRIVAEGDVASLRLGSIRRVRVRVDDADAAEVSAALTALAGVEGVEAPGRGLLTATIEGAIDPFVKAISRFEVHELTVEEPDLEESVLRLYGDNREGDDREGGR
ncbi:ABC transporter ATP-binding protein [Microbacterium pseudoresistens]|uniref:ABC-2 type transport system ATP-binding protein n=1 Tax=Microbacterium pseudoresistens TaxID=640634 RepID=A0A7Y9JMD7_9MICO|nr:ABC transporter ATP-binding protein [Microbacterium pseudoresistens]NYD53916.1 ABC-2 type transport system ATP-binding protein [Microbacterium pseudoresistens]